MKSHVLFIAHLWNPLVLTALFSKFSRITLESHMDLMLSQLAGLKLTLWTTEHLPIETLAWFLKDNCGWNSQSHIQSFLRMLRSNLSEPRDPASLRGREFTYSHFPYLGLQFPLTLSVLRSSTKIIFFASPPGKKEIVLPVSI